MKGMTEIKVVIWLGIVDQHKSSLLEALYSS